MSSKAPSKPARSIKSGAEFKQRVLTVVAQIPEGRVMTYGQIASLCGSPRAARIVGGIAHWSDPTLPWQRVVKYNGGLAEGFPGGVQGHREALEAEGVAVGPDSRIDVERLLWRP